MKSPTNSSTRRRSLTAHGIGLLVAAIIVNGCSFPTWMSRRPACTFDPNVTKEQLVAHLNQNILGDATQGGLASWRSGSVQLRTGMYPPAPASIAVETPRNLRLMVSNPLSRGLEMDIGSNRERFWVWAKETQQVVTASHEDIGLANQYLPTPVPMQPEWLMEIFGVIPINPEEFKMLPGPPESGTIDLVALRKGPSGESVERVIRVDTCRGQIVEHVIRHPGGAVIASARLDRYVSMNNGIMLPMRYKLRWPEQHLEIAMDISRAEVNPAGMEENTQLWEMPNLPGSEVVDLGIAARNSAMVRPSVLPVEARETPGQATLFPSPQLDAPSPEFQLPESSAGSATLEDAATWNAIE